MSKRSNSLPELNKSKHQTIFIYKLYDMLQDPKLDRLIWWASASDSFFIVPSEQFLKALSQYFKHTNIASFIRQLNMYGFHKVNNSEELASEKQGDTAVWEFKHSHNQFRKGDTDLLQHIKRRSSKNINKEVVLDPSEDYYFGQQPVSFAVASAAAGGAHSGTHGGVHPVHTAVHGTSHPPTSATHAPSQHHGPQGPSSGPSPALWEAHLPTYPASPYNMPNSPHHIPRSPQSRGSTSSHNGNAGGFNQYFPYQQYQQFQQYQALQPSSNISVDKYLELLNNFNHLKFELANLLNKFDYFLNEYKFQQKNNIKLIEILQSNNLNDLNNFKHYLLLNLNNSIILNDNFNKSSSLGATNQTDLGVVQNYALNPRYNVHKASIEEERPVTHQTNLAPAGIPQVKEDRKSSTASEGANIRRSVPFIAVGTGTSTPTPIPPQLGPPLAVAAPPPAVPFHQPFTGTPITPQTIFPTSDPSSNLVLPTPLNMAHKPSRSYLPLLRDEKLTIKPADKIDKIEKFEKNYQYPFPAIDPPTPRQSIDKEAERAKVEKDTEERHKEPRIIDNRETNETQETQSHDSNEPQIDPVRKRSYQLPSISQLDEVIKMRKMSD